MTEFRDIPDIPGYRVGDDGSVWSCWKSVYPKGQGRLGRYMIRSEHWHQLSPVLNPKTGYRQVTPRGCRTWVVGRLVLLAFVGPRLPGQVMCHGPNGKLDDSLSNLSWGTYKQNSADMVRDGTRLYGETNPWSKLTEEDVLEIRRLGKSVSLRELAAHYGVCEHTICRARNKKRWKHVEVVI